MLHSGFRNAVQLHIMCDIMDKWKDSSAMGATPSQVTTGVQQYLVSGDGLFTALPNVWEAPTPPIRLFPHSEFS